MSSNKIIYYVACSLDGYIADAQGSPAQFLSQGDHVEHYQKKLLEFKTTIMGRKTYEFAYQFGLEPGQSAYSHMKHYIFSKNLEKFNSEQVQVVNHFNSQTIEEIQNSSDSDIYLCGGGEFAGSLLAMNKINEVWLKINPILIGHGIGVFGHKSYQHLLHPYQIHNFDSGVIEIKYKVNE